LRELLGAVGMVDDDAEDGDEREETAARLVFLCCQNYASLFITM
jgi:hypothetical protein